MNKYKLDQEEQEILELFEQGKLKRSANYVEDKLLAEKLARQHINKIAVLNNIKLSQFDLDKIKRVAANEGIPYKTLIASILHKYAVGTLPIAEDNNL